MCKLKKRGQIKLKSINKAPKDEKLKEKTGVRVLKKDFVCDGPV